MIGLEYILNLYNITQQQLADELNIKKQNVSRWFKGDRKIPEKYLEYLNDKFKIPIEYFDMQLKKSDELEIKIIKLKNENPPQKVTRVYDNKEWGRYEYEEEVYDEEVQKEITMLNVEIQRQELLETIYEMINFNFANKIDNLKEYVDENRKVIGVFSYIVTILESKKIEPDVLIEVLNAVVLAYGIDEGIDARPLVRHLEMIFQCYEFDKSLKHSIHKTNK